jgi:hypothetical protein
MKKKCPHCNRVSETDDFCTLHGKVFVTMKPVIDFKSTLIKETKIQSKTTGK